MDEERVNHPKHYNAHPSGVECIDVVEHLPFNAGNAIKYIWRAGHKGSYKEDIEKARWYTRREYLRLAYTQPSVFDRVLRFFGAYPMLDAPKEIEALISRYLEVEPNRRIAECVYLLAETARGKLSYESLARVIILLDMEAGRAS